MRRSDGWLRVQRDRPCPICHKTDWCLIHADGSVAICPRVESPKRAGEAGWLHRLEDARHRRPGPRVRTIPLRAAAAPSKEMADLASRCELAVQPTLLAGLVKRLGVSAEALYRLRIGWSSAHAAWTFPMSDAAGHVLGIRLRREDGSKYSIQGSRQGLHIPRDGLKGPTLFAAEGVTDAAALLDMGYSDVVGRPSCRGGASILAELIRRHRITQVLVVGDSDEAGRNGAEATAAELTGHVPDVRVITPPPGIKDARAWLNAGATRHDIEGAIQAAPAWRLSVQVVWRDCRHGR